MRKLHYIIIYYIRYCEGEAPVAALKKHGAVQLFEEKVIGDT